VKQIAIEDALKLENPLFIDIRAPIEYHEATIEGAINVPLFNDEERAEIGTIYRQTNPQQAKMRGLEIFSAKLPNLVNEFYRLAELKRPLIIFCWRGGMRSESLTTFLPVMGVKCSKLIGGYKVYRRFVNSFLEEPKLPIELIVLHGLTGVGKTEVIKELANLDVGVLDLEAMANNRGSVFGKIGLGPQPSQKMFEGKLVQKIIQEQTKKVMITESESKRIGRINIPKVFFQQMEAGKHILLYDKLTNRVSRIARMYTTNTNENKEELKAAIELLVKRIGKAKVEELKAYVDTDNDQWIKFLLTDYYDPMYKYTSEPDDSFDLSVSTEDIQGAARQIREYIIKNF
jgi:tRNA 2-selenouridine synthase